MQKFLILFFSSLFFTTNIIAVQSEEHLEAAIIGKVAKYITWENEQSEKDFVITVLDNPFGDILDEAYNGKTILSRKVHIAYIDSIDELTQTDILYIPTSKELDINEILAKIKSKNILSISKIRGFAEREGGIQISFVAQKMKLKINLNTIKENNLQVKSALLRISDVIQKEN